jgi:tRNA-dihydrouridine synthase
MYIGENGASLTWTEMVRAQALLRGNKATFDLIDTYDSTVSTGLQLLVKNASQLHSALKLIEDLSSNDYSKSHLKNIVAIDLNFGCPSPGL